MGCDIHMYVEYKRKNKSVWENGDYFTKGGTWAEEDGYERKELHGSRNYTLFTTLAGVRDYGEGSPMVAEPKGLPEDVTDYVKQESDEDGCDGHTHSWLTLKELKDFQATEPRINYSGMISPEQAKALDEEGKRPNSWCQWTNHEDYVRREWTENNPTLVPLIEKLERRAFELLQSDWDEKYDPAHDQDIRIVFWFDN